MYYAANRLLVYDQNQVSVFETKTSMKSQTIWPLARAFSYSSGKNPQEPNPHHLCQLYNQKRMSEGKFYKYNIEF